MQYYINKLSYHLLKIRKKDLTKKYIHVHIYIYIILYDTFTWGIISEMSAEKARFFWKQQYIPYRSLLRLQMLSGWRYRDSSRERKIGRRICRIEEMSEEEARKNTKEKFVEILRMEYIFAVHI